MEDNKTKTGVGTQVDDYLAYLEGTRNYSKKTIEAYALDLCPQARER